jgi:hypothetical protein
MLINAGDPPSLELLEKKKKKTLKKTTTLEWNQPPFFSGYR